MPKAKLIIGKDRLLIYEGIIFWLWKRKIELSLRYTRLQF